MQHPSMGLSYRAPEMLLDTLAEEDTRPNGKKRNVKYKRQDRIPRICLRRLPSTLSMVIEETIATTPSCCSSTSTEGSDR